jgi:hypothetical protein
MDFLKTRAPFWKKEHVRGGKAQSEAEGGWVEAKAEDDEAAGALVSISTPRQGPITRHGDNGHQPAPGPWLLVSSSSLSRS